MRCLPPPAVNGYWVRKLSDSESGSALPQSAGHVWPENWPKHVLIVDDDPAMRTMIADYLADQNFRVSTAADGREMARVLAAGGVDLAVLDLKLGHENGLEIVRSLRADSDLPIIVVTGQHRDEIDRVVGLELGADDYLTKPFSPRELLARIRAVLRRSELQARRPDQESEASFGTALPAGSSACGAVV